MIDTNGRHERTVGVDPGGVALIGRWVDRRKTLRPPRNAPLFCTLEGKRLSAASVAVADLASGLNTGCGQAGKLGDAVGRSATVLLESLVEHTEERLLMGGTANLTRNTADFGGSLRSVLEALEEQVVVLRLLAAQQDAGRVTVRIGHETEAEQMAGTSVVTTTYGSAGTVYGGMGVVGPTRMDYPGTMANVAAVAMYIGEVLGNRAG